MTFIYINIKQCSSHPENKNRWAKQWKDISEQPNIIIRTPYMPLQSVLSWLTLRIISHLLMTHMQMSKVLIIFDKQLS